MTHPPDPKKPAPEAADGALADENNNGVTVSCAGCSATLRTHRLTPYYRPHAESLGWHHDGSGWRCPVCLAASKKSDTRASTGAGEAWYETYCACGRRLPCVNGKSYEETFEARGWTRSTKDRTFCPSCTKKRDEEAAKRERLERTPGTCPLYPEPCPVCSDRAVRCSIEGCTETTSSFDGWTQWGQNHYCPQHVRLADKPPSDATYDPEANAITCAYAGCPSASINPSGAGWERNKAGRWTCRAHASVDDTPTEASLAGIRKLVHATAKLALESVHPRTQFTAYGEQLSDSFLRACRALGVDHDDAENLREEVER